MLTCSAKTGRFAMRWRRRRFARLRRKRERAEQRAWIGVDLNAWAADIKRRARFWLWLREEWGEEWHAE